MQSLGTQFAGHLSLVVKEHSSSDTKAPEKRP